MGALARHGKEKSRVASPDEVIDQREPRDGLDLDVPAAVVCARCGSADCAGCEDDDMRSGVIAIIAWERRDAPMLRRLWQTARATTRDPRAFFEALPDGPFVPALGFAVTSELVAVTAMVLAIAPLIGAVAPLSAKAMVLDPSLRSLALRVLVGGIPALAALLVLAHAAHGLALDIGARRSGACPARLRALRFGLYAAGWDLVLGPVGVVVLAFKEGVGSVVGLARIGSGLPTRSARAFLRGAYGLYGQDADRAVRASYVAAIIGTLIAALSILGSLVALMLV